MGRRRCTMNPLLDRQHVDGTDIRCTGEQLVGHLAQRRRNLTIEVRLPARVVVEGVEYPVRGVADLERVPRHRARLRSSEIAPTLQELPQILTLAGLGLEQGEHTECRTHCHSLPGCPHRTYPND